MRSGHVVAVVIPALDEESAIAGVLAALPDWLDQVIVVDNGSTDRTAQVAAAAGATVVHEARRGYGSACLRGIEAAGAADILVFLDADGSSDPEEMARLVDPIAEGRADLVLGSRTLGLIEPGAMTPPQRMGNALAPALIRRIWGAPFTDLGPFRSIRAAALARLRMDDAGFGWTIQMQIRAARIHLRWLEIPVRAKRRVAGNSKISGTARGVLGAGAKILYVIAEELMSPSARSTAPYRTLAVLTKFPVPGAVKTRLIPCLGAIGAATLHTRMIEHTLQSVARLAERLAVDLEVWVAGSSARDFRERFGSQWAVRIQPEGTFGDRLARAFDSMLASSSAAVVVGTDCPRLSPAILGRSFECLQSHDLVLGPANDGGYYLIGLRRRVPALFDGIDWGTSSVLAQTLSRASRVGLSVALLEPLDDVDRPEDLTAWTGRDKADPDLGPPPELSIVIPTLNESNWIARTIAAVRGERVEVIVADGGSTDDTTRIAALSGARVVLASKGRGPQLNAGALMARSPRLLFLHADTSIPENFVELIRRCLDSPDVAIGAFRLVLDRSDALLKLIGLAVRVRCFLFRTPRGDQALFMRADTYKELGGFAPIPALEDVDIVQRAKRLGRVVVLGEAAVTSARRWIGAGTVTTTLVNQICLLGFSLGVSPARLAAMRSRWTDRARVSACAVAPRTASAGPSEPHARSDEP